MHFKTIKLHTPCTDGLLYFDPPNMHNSNGSSFFQPQCINGTLCLVASFMDRRKSVKRDCDGIFKMAVPNRHHRRVAVFCHHDVERVGHEMKSRFLDHELYRDCLFEIHALSKNGDSDTNGQRSFTFILYLVLLFLQGGFGIDTVRPHLNSISFEKMQKFVFDRIMQCLDQKFVPGRVSRAKRL